MISSKLDSTNNIFYYSAITQHTNAGDALINRELISLMRSHGKVKAIIGKMPKSFIREIGLEENELIGSGYFILIFLSLLDKIKGKKVYMVQTPGDISLKKVNFSDILKLLLFVFLKVILGYKFIQVGISLGNFSSFGKMIFSVKSKFIDFLGLRDKASICYAENNKFNNFEYFPDLAFSSKIINRNYAKLDKYKICFSFRGDNLNEIQIEEILFKLKEIIESSNNLEVYLCVQVERDLILMNKIKEKLSISSDIYTNFNIDSLSSYYSQMDIVISNRLHVLLLAGSNGCLPIALIHEDINKKIDGLFKTINLKNNVYYFSDELIIDSLIEKKDVMIGDFKNIFKEQNYILHDKFKNIIDPKWK